MTVRADRDKVFFGIDRVLLLLGGEALQVMDMDEAPAQLTIRFTKVHPTNDPSGSMVVDTLQ